MTNEQHEHIQFGLDWAKAHIQDIEAGPHDLSTQLHEIEFELVLLLDDVIEALPAPLRVQAQVCRKAYKRVRDARMAEVDTHIAQLKAQKEASSNSLATTS